MQAAVATIGYDILEDDLTSVNSKGLSDTTCEVLTHINAPSPDIDGGAHVGKDEMDLGGHQVL